MWGVVQRLDQCLREGHAAGSWDAHSCNAESVVPEGTRARSAPARRANSRSGHCKCCRSCNFEAPCRMRSVKKRGSQRVPKNSKNRRRRSFCGIRAGLPTIPQPLAAPRSRRPRPAALATPRGPPQPPTASRSPSPALRDPHRMPRPSAASDHVLQPSPRPATLRSPRPRPAARRQPSASLTACRSRREPHRMPQPSRSLRPRPAVLATPCDTPQPPTAPP